MNKYPQFIYGKLSDENSQRYIDYEVVAQSSELNEQSNIHQLISQYKFWNNSSSKPPQAVGFFLQNNKIVLVQISPPTPPIYRYFEPYRYVLIPDNDLIFLKNRIFKIITWFLKQNIPPVVQKDFNYEKLSIPILGEEISEKNKQKEAELIQKCLNEKNIEGNPFLFSVLALLINGKKLIINNNSQKLSADIYYLYSTLLLLPASCRIQIPTVVGNIDEDVCSRWADILIKAVNFESVRVPKNCIWLDRDSGQFIGVDNLEVFNSQYVDKVREFITENPDKIQQLIEQLDEITDPSITLETIASDCFQVISQIPIFNDLQSQVCKNLQNDIQTKKLANLVMDNCNFKYETPEVLNKISQLRKEPTNCDFVFLLLEDIDRSKPQNNLPEFTRLTKQKKGVVFSEIIDYVSNCPDSFNDYKRFINAKHEGKDQLRQIEDLDRILGNQVKFIINLANEWLLLITNLSINKEHFQKSIAWKQLLSKPENYLNELVKQKSLNYKNLITLTNCFLSEQRIDLVQGGKVLVPLIKNWNSDRTTYTESDLELIAKLISRDADLDLDKQLWLKLIPILLNPQLELQKNINLKIKNCVTNFTQDDKQLLLSQVKSTISVIKRPGQTQQLLNKCELLGLSKNEQIKLLQMVSQEAFNYQVLKNYIDVEKLNIKEDNAILNLIFNLPSSSLTENESEIIYFSLFKSLIISENIEIKLKKEYETKIFENIKYVQKEQFINKIACEILNSYSLNKINKILINNNSLTCYDLLKEKIKEKHLKSFLTEEIIKEERQKAINQKSNLETILKETLKTEIEPIKTDIISKMKENLTNLFVEKQDLNLNALINKLESFSSQFNTSIDNLTAQINLQTKQLTELTKKVNFQTKQLTETKNKNSNKQKNDSSQTVNKENENADKQIKEKVQPNSQEEKIADTLLKQQTEDKPIETKKETSVEKKTNTDEARKSTDKLELPKQTGESKETRINDSDNSDSKKKKELKTFSSNSEISSKKKLDSDLGKNKKTINTNDQATTWYSHDT